MNFVIDRAEVGYSSNLSLFSAPAVNTAIEGVYTKHYNSLGTINKGSVIEFDIQNTSSDYISLKDIYTVTKLSIVDNKDKPITATADVALINMPAATIFRQIDFNIQHQNLNASIGSHYPYKALLDVLLNNDSQSQETWLRASGFSKDSAKVMDSHEPANSVNEGLKTRHALTADGAKATLTSRLYIDALNQHRLLLNQVPINIKLYPANDAFCLMYKNKTGTSYSLKIEEVSLCVRFVKLNPSLLLHQNHDLRSEAAIYPFQRGEIKTYNIAKGVGNWSQENVFQDNIPNKLLICMVDSEAYNGQNQKNPFNFQNFQLNYVDFTINGVTRENYTLFPSFEYETSNAEGVKTKHGNDDYNLSYLNLFKQCYRTEGIIPNISHLDFKHGYCIHKFEIGGADLSSMSTPLRKGQTTLTLKFNKSLDAPVTVLVYGVFNSLFKIDESRNLTVET